jgi:pyruvate formate-lyase activating enzyme-like uncharacterized protein
MENKKLRMANAENQIGWIYHDLKWLNQEKAISANKKRDDLLRSLSNEANHSFMQSKIHTGNLSPGCSICGEGHWSCLFINRLCTKNCFYCPQDRKIKKESRPQEEIVFDEPKDYVNYLKTFGLKGVGISGGEALLVFDKLLDYIQKIKEEFGKKIYLWVYTNGDLINEEKIRRMQQSGLDEIRFNISAGAYDLGPAKLATDLIDNVTVEIPSIPEDYETVKKSLSEMQKIGIGHLNLHQLFATKYNYKNYIDRNYTFLHHSSFPIFESEITALKLLRYALDKNIDLPINYCSATYKDRFQYMGIRARKALLMKKDFEELTDLKYIRRLSVQDTPANIKTIIDALKMSKTPPKLWSLGDTKEEIFIHGSLLRNIDFDKHSLNIDYFCPEFSGGTGTGELGYEIKLNPENRFFINKVRIANQKFSNPVTIKSFQKLFVEKANEKAILKYFHSNYEVKTKADLMELRDESKKLLALKQWEQPETGFPEIY